MNLEYGLTFFHFNRRFIHYVTNETWAKGGIHDSDNATSRRIDLEMKRKLRRGRYTDLNLYFQSQYFNNTEFYGYCTFPMPGIVVNSDNFFTDGCNIDQKTL